MRQPYPEVSAVLMWSIFISALALWLLGVVGSVGGLSIHLFLVVAATVVVTGTMTSSRRTF